MRLKRSLSRCSASRCSRRRVRRRRRTSTPRTEFKLEHWVPIHLGPIDMSINKAVVYLLLGAALSILIGILHDALAPQHRRRAAGRPSAR